MKLLFLTLGDMPSIKHHEIYPDLLREFIKNGHEVYVACARERRYNLPTELFEEAGAKLLKIHVGNITKTNIIEKGISTVLIGQQYKVAIKKYFSNVKFDLVMYSTPPITLAGVVEYVKKRDDAKTYLLLKDIFPQNAVDIGVLSKKGIKGIIYRFFRRKEKKLYAISDRIGCMSQANVNYIIEHNPEIELQKVEVCPNSIEVFDKSVSEEEKIVIRNKYNIPLDKKVLVYGGNLGKPQGIDFLIECLRSLEKNEEVFFLIVGDGTEYPKIEKYVCDEKPHDVCLMKSLPKEDYDLMVGACDVGMIFLDHRFTIPNFPSRILSYMQAKIPVLAVTDSNTDIGQVIVKGSFGWWCESNDVGMFAKNVKIIAESDLKEKGELSYQYLNRHYSTKSSYMIIQKFLRGSNE